MKIVNSYIFRAVCAFAYRPFVSIQSGEDDRIVGASNRWIVSDFRISLAH